MPRRKKPTKGEVYQSIKETLETVMTTLDELIELDGEARDGGEATTGRRSGRAAKDDGKPASGRRRSGRAKKDDGPTADDVRDLATKVIEEFGNEEILDILGEFDAKKISDLDPKDYAAVVAECNKALDPPATE